MDPPSPAPSSPGFIPSSPPFTPPSPYPTIEDELMEYPVAPNNVDTAPFFVLSTLFDRLQNERKPDRRRKLLGSWFNHWREEKGNDLYPVLRLILPQKDRERAVYGLKEKNLAKIYIKMIPLGNKDPDAIRLLNWKRPTERDKSSGDFPTVLFEVVSKRSSIIEGTLSIEDLNDTLDLLAQNMGKSDIQLKVMQKIYNRTTPEEQRWIVRIILKDMNISVKETSVFSVFHPDAHDLFNTCSDLKKVAWELWDPKRRLNEEDKAIQLFRAFAPMLCKRPTHKLEDSVKEMQGSTFIIEEKLDGERMQLHKRGNEYFYCSRKGKDYTYLYGKHIGSGSLTPFIDEAFDSRIESIVLDGEMLVWDPVSERNLPFGTLKKAALDKSKKEHNPRPCFKIFDLLHLNGIDLLHKSLKFRKRNLRSCLTEVKGRLEFANESEGKTAQDIRNKMEEIIASKGEGLVIKHPGSEYILNGRNKDWIKIKPEYMDNMGETVDVLVVGGCYGSGRRAGGVSTIICAVVDDRRQTDDDDDIKYTTFVRIGTGLSFADYVWVRQKPWKKYNPRDPPKFLQVSRKGTDDKPDLYLEPEDSFILKVKAAEIISTGFTMRFPRALMIRDDLSIDDCMTASAVLESVRSEKKRKMGTDEGSEKKKKRKVTAKKITVLPEYQGVKLKDVKVETDLFAGMKFMVASDPKSRTGDEDKKQLLKLIHANGGSYTQVAAKHPNLMVVYGGKTTPYDIKMIMNKGQYDIIKPAWITDSIQKGERVPMRQKYFFHATATRIDDDEYELEEEPEEQAPSPPLPQSTKPEIPIDTQLEQLDPALADWFHIDDEKLAAARSKEKRNGGDDSDTLSETETEADSENEDVKREETDEWIDLRGVSEATTRATEEPGEDGDMVVVERPEPEEALEESSKMGEDEAAMEYDQDLIFKHLCFYLDSPDNARKNGMTIKAKYEALITKNFETLSTLITSNGGKIVDIDSPKLTHIIIDKRDSSRRVLLGKRTSKPKRRNIVVAEFIQACLDEETLLDEDGEFFPLPRPGFQAMLHHVPHGANNVKLILISSELGFAP